jgi:hypothetical protein
MKKIFTLLILILTLTANGQIVSFIRHGDTVYCYFPSTRDSIKVNHGVTIGGATWGGLAGNIGDQTDLQSLVSALLPKTTTSGVAASPTASGTQTITHGLGRVPTIIRIYGIGAFVNSTSATPTPFSMGTFNSSGNRCVYMTSNGTTAQASQTSTVFAVFLATSAGNTVSGVVGNLTSTSFDIVWTEVGTSAAQNFLWEAQ